MRFETRWPLRAIPFAWWVILPAIILPTLTGMIGFLGSLGPWGAPLQFILIGVLAILLIYLGTGRADRFSVGLEESSASRSIIVFMGSLILFYFGMYLFSLRSDPTAQTQLLKDQAQMLNIGSGFADELSVILCVTFLAPVMEELAFRGVVFRGLRDGLFKGGLFRRGHTWLRLPAWASLVIAVAVSAVIFASIHGGKGQDGMAAQYILYASVLALSYHLSGTLMVPVTLHATTNSVSYLQVALADGAPELSERWLLGLAACGPLFSVLTLVALQALLPRARPVSAAA